MYAGSEGDIFNRRLLGSFVEISRSEVIGREFLALLIPHGVLRCDDGDGTYEMTQMGLGTPEHIAGS